MHGAVALDAHGGGIELAVKRVDRLAAGKTPVGEKHLVEQRGGGAGDDGAKIVPTFFKDGGTHVFAGEIVSADQRGVLVEYGDFAMIAEVGRPPRGERDHRHEPHDLATGFADGINEAAAGENAAEGVELQANLHALTCAFGEELNETPTGVVAPEDKRGDVDGVFGSLDERFEFRVGLFTGRDEAHGVATRGFTGAGGGEGVGGGEVGDLGSDGGDARQTRDDGAFALGEAFDFASAEEQVERHADVGDQDDHEQPGDGVARGAFFADEAGDRKDGEHKAAHGEKVGVEAVAYGLGDLGVHGSGVRVRVLACHRQGVKQWVRQFLKLPN